MEKSPRLFIDSNVVVSSLRSTTGASYHLLNETDAFCLTSSECRKEIEETSTHPFDLTNIKVVKLTLSDTEVMRSYSKFVTDPDDAHVVAGAKQSKAKLLITHNLRHFKIDKIKEELGIEVITPGRFVQSLRNS